VDPGNIVHATDANGLLVITQIRPISVIFPIAEDHLPQVLPQLRAGKTPPVEAWDRDQTHKLADGVLATIDNQIDQTTGTVRLRATFPNTDDELFPNQLVYARLLVEEKSGVTLIPTAAIQRTTTSTYVYLVKPDSTVTVREISVGISEGDQSEILSGLAPGDMIVMTGVDKLNEGSRVNVQGSGAGQGSGGSQGRGPGIPSGRSGGSTQ
jgi:multidrug efflux system membrane fusion protein